MTKTIVRTALAAALTFSVVGLAQNVRADDKPAVTAPATKDLSAKGVIESVDATAGTVTIMHKKEKQTFTLGAHATLSGEDKKDIKIADLKKGDHIIIKYTD